jgi:hypothetical protein
VSERSAIVLIDGATREPVEATLIDGVTVTEMKAADRAWLPYLRRAVRDAKARGVTLDQLPEHKHWEWRRKARYMTPDSRGFGIECDGEMQALMLIMRRGKRCRLEGQQGRLLVYIDYITTAPWNLSGLTTAPRYRGSGLALVGSAVELSLKYGYDGRIGLHSLPQAEEFYRGRCGMIDLDLDEDYEGLRYFEMTAPQAMALLERTR